MTKSAKRKCPRIGQDFPKTLWLSKDDVGASRVDPYKQTAKWFAKEGTGVRRYVRADCLPPSTEAEKLKAAVVKIRGQANLALTNLGNQLNRDQTAPRVRELAIYHLHKILDVTADATHPIPPSWSTGHMCKCLRCEEFWLPRIPGNRPKSCPSCQSKKWDIERISK